MKVIRNLVTGVCLVGTTLVMVPPTWAMTTAIIDSGVDTQHFQLRDRIFVNAVDSTFNNLDEDNNGFVDDVHGWNFAENNSQVIDYKYQGTFSKDVYLFFEIQGKMLEGAANPQEMAWMTEKKKGSRVS